MPNIHNKGDTGKWFNECLGGHTSLLKDYPMAPDSRHGVQKAREDFAGVVMANQITGQELCLANFSKKPNRTVKLAVLNHFAENGIITRSEDTMVSSIIKYLPPAKYYLPDNIIYTPEAPIRFREGKEKESQPMFLDTPEKRELAARLKAWWSFIQGHEIKTNISRETFDIFNQYQIEIKEKDPLIYPEGIMSKPYFSFNNREMTKGGRLYGAWWIHTKKIFRRAMTIDGELTADIDGKGMHVQLLYKEAGATMPEGDPYLYTGKLRDICKGLMLLIMNTNRDHENTYKGRQAVRWTYCKGKFVKADKDTLYRLMLELEVHHHKILPYLYKSNWGRLQMTEARIIMRIMEAGMQDGVVILPVHDGALCRRRDKRKVLGYFTSEGIVAAENLKHLKPIPTEETREALKHCRIAESR